MDAHEAKVMKYILDEMRSMAGLLDQHINEAQNQIKKQTENDDRNIVIKRAWTLLDTFYSWGGDDPSGFDCSGFICELLQGVGLVHRKEDLNAQMIWDKFTTRKVDKPYKGCLVFWHSSSDPGRVIHIELCLNSRLAMGASGGGSRTITMADAIRDNAFIKIRPWESRRHVKGFVDPFKQLSPESTIIQ